MEILALLEIHAVNNRCMEMLVSLETSTVHTKYRDIVAPPVIITVRTGLMEMFSPLEVHAFHLIGCMEMLALGLRFCGFRTETTELDLIKQFSNRRSVEDVTLNLSSIPSSFSFNQPLADCRHTNGIESSRVMLDELSPQNIILAVQQNRIFSVVLG
jgi:hypothetical protein